MGRPRRKDRAVFLPLLGVVMALSGLGMKTARGATIVARQAAPVPGPAWEPATAFFSRSRVRAGAMSAHTDPWAEEARQKVDLDGPKAA